MLLAPFVQVFLWLRLVSINRNKKQSPTPWWIWHIIILILLFKVYYLPFFSVASSDSLNPQRDREDADVALYFIGQHRAGKSGDGDGDRSSGCGEQTRCFRPVAVGSVPFTLSRSWSNTKQADGNWRTDSPSGTTGVCSQTGMVPLPYTSCCVSVIWNQPPLPPAAGRPDEAAQRHFCRFVGLAGTLVLVFPERRPVRMFFFFFSNKTSKFLLFDNLGVFFIPSFCSNSLM